MATAPTLDPSLRTREVFRARGGETANRCYQCGTCTSVCRLATEKSVFPRRQMLLAQWGLGDRLTSDAGVWLCYRCNDCTTHCPRDAKPGDVMQVARAVTIERLAVPPAMGTLVAKARVTWPLLLGIPVLFWIGFIALVSDLEIPQPP